MTDHKIAAREEWLSAREQLLAREKEHTRLGDQLAQERRDLPGCAWRRSTASTRTTVRRRWASCSTALPVARLPLHVRPQLPGRLPGQLVDRRHRQRCAPSPCALVTCRSCSSPRRRWKSCRPTSTAWAGAFPVLATPTSTSTSASSFTEEQAREAVAAEGDRLAPQSSATGPETGTGLPPIVEQNARSSGTDAVGYLTESPGFSTFVCMTAPSPRTRRRGADWSS